MVVSGPRRLDLVDALVLVAVPAAGFGLIHAVELFFVGRVIGGSNGRGCVAAAVPFLIASTAACLVMILRRPRPTGQRLRQPPGMLACVAAALAIGFETAWNVVMLARHGRAGFHRGLIPGAQGLMQSTYAEPVSFCVAGAWLTLALARRWRPEPTWPDRLGRIVGILWIAAGALSLWG
jgi:hypothetical protein